MAHTRQSADSTAPPETRPATKQLGIRLPARLTDRLQAIARHESNSVSSVARRLLTAALNGDEAA
jgi:predicted DNA-binding protein